MDHHCPYINQCVGLHNHKVFVMFLFYITIGMSYCEFFFLYGTRVYRISEGIDSQVSLLEGTMIGLNIIILGFCILSTLILFVNQIHLIAHNMTKIELWTKHWATMDAKDRGERYHYPYDLGLWNNFRQFFGKSILLWFIPTITEDSGLNFPELVSPSALTNLSTTTPSSSNNTSMV